jgi:hypothetical protein
MFVRVTSIMCSNVSYIRFLMYAGASSGRGGDMYAMSSAYVFRCGILAGIRATKCGLSCLSANSQVRSHSVGIDLSFLLCNHIRRVSSARHLAIISQSAQPPCSFGLIIVEKGTLKIAPCQRYQLTADVSCCVHFNGAGKT